MCWDMKFAVRKVTLWRGLWHRSILKIVQRQVTAKTPPPASGSFTQKSTRLRSCSQTLLTAPGAWPGWLLSHSELGTRWFKACHMLAEDLETGSRNCGSGRLLRLRQNRSLPWASYVRRAIQMMDFHVVFFKSKWEKHPQSNSGCVCVRVHVCNKEEQWQ